MAWPSRWTWILANSGRTFSLPSFQSSNMWLNLWHVHEQILRICDENLEKTLESPLDCMEIKPVHPKGNQAWIFIGRSEAEAEAPILWPLDATNDSLEKTLILGKIEGKRRRGWQRMRWLYGIMDSINMNLSKLWERVKDQETWRAAVHGDAKSWTWLSDWMVTTAYKSDLSMQWKEALPRLTQAQLVPTRPWN